MSLLSRLCSLALHPLVYELPIIKQHFPITQLVKHNLCRRHSYFIRKIAFVVRRRRIIVRLGHVAPCWGSQYSFYLLTLSTSTSASTRIVFVGVKHYATSSALNRRVCGEQNSAQIARRSAVARKEVCEGTHAKQTAGYGGVPADFVVDEPARRIRQHAGS